MVMLKVVSYLVEAKGKSLHGLTLKQQCRSQDDAVQLHVALDQPFWEKVSKVS